MTSGIDASLPERAHATIVLTSLSLTNRVFLPMMMRDE
jgi:hypothetical protein